MTAVLDKSLEEKILGSIPLGNARSRPSNKSERVNLRSQHAFRDENFNGLLSLQTARASFIVRYRCFVLQYARLPFLLQRLEHSLIQCGCVLADEV
jgi:hypothetical protein